MVGICLAGGHLRMWWGIELQIHSCRLFHRYHQPKVCGFCLLSSILQLRNIRAWHILCCVLYLKHIGRNMELGCWEGACHWSHWTLPFLCHLLRWGACYLRQSARVRQVWDKAAQAEVGTQSLYLEVVLFLCMLLVPGNFQLGYHLLFIDVLVIH